MEALKGKKTYIAAAGLVLLGVARLVGGDVVGGVQDVIAALGVFGLRSAIATQPAA